MTFGSQATAEFARTKCVAQMWMKSFQSASPSPALRLARREELPDLGFAPCD